MTKKVTLARGDSAYLYFTFTGLPDGAAAQIQVGTSLWGSVDFSTGRARVLVQGPDAPAGSGLVVPASGPIRVQFISAPETRTISGGYLALVQAS